MIYLLHEEKVIGEVLQRQYIWIKEINICPVPPVSKYTTCKIAHNKNLEFQLHLEQLYVVSQLA